MHTYYLIIIANLHKINGVCEVGDTDICSLRKILYQDNATYCQYF